jgi:hypothetical protein
VFEDSHYQKVGNAYQRLDESSRFADRVRKAMNLLINMRWRNRHHPLGGKAYEAILRSGTVSLPNSNSRRYNES